MFQISFFLLKGGKNETEQVFVFWIDPGAVLRADVDDANPGLGKWGGTPTVPTPYVVWLSEIHGRDPRSGGTVPPPPRTPTPAAATSGGSKKFVVV